MRRWRPARWLALAALAAGTLGLAWHETHAASRSVIVGGSGNGCHCTRRLEP